MKAKIVLFSLATVCISYFSFKVGFQEGVVSQSSSSIDVIEPELPACDFNGCPAYEAIDTDGDGNLESVVYQKIAMTKGAGTIWIIDDNEVVFKHGGGAQFGYEELDDGSGLLISYVSEYDETGIEPKTWTREKWVYSSGRYNLDSSVEITH